MASRGQSDARSKALAGANRALGSSGTGQTQRLLAGRQLSVGQIYLYNNPLLKEPLKLSDVNVHCRSALGTTPGQNFIYVHLNRVIKLDYEGPWWSTGLSMPSTTDEEQTFYSSVGQVA